MNFGDVIALERKQYELKVSKTKMIELYYHHPNLYSNTFYAWNRSMKHISSSSSFHIKVTIKTIEDICVEMISIAIKSSNFGKNLLWFSKLQFHFPKKNQSMQRKIDFDHIQTAIHPQFDHVYLVSIYKI